MERGSVLVTQGGQGSDLYLLLDGVLRVNVDGARMAEYGSGAMLGERVNLGGGKRTSSLFAVTDCRRSSLPAKSLDRDALRDISSGHRREESNAV